MPLLSWPPPGPGRTAPVFHHCSRARQECRAVPQKSRPGCYSSPFPKFLLSAFLSSPRPCGHSVAVSRVLKVARGAAAETKMLKLWVGRCHH
ncbi:hypothetical protein AAFF_G00178980 [Aldrovandia affinis]|uniref:Uncharacterized protein n=1 Tax=Aldrovandia affinis TaxID=143900 RepID=A0AAD7RKF3_9TELE|nr:hypothetical protein AAFF_G00178980 [Aldrovandia affinis]